jgi:hypothetical protein
MTLTYNPSSGAIKRDGAVVGTIVHDARKKKPYSVTFYAKGKKTNIKPAETVEELLPQIKKVLTDAF